MKINKFLPLIGLVLLVTISLVSTHSYAVGPAVVQDQEIDQLNSFEVNAVFPGQVAANDYIIAQVYINSSIGLRYTLLDNQSNVYHLITSVNSTGSPWDFTAIYYALNTVLHGVRVQFNVSTSSQNIGLFVYEISGITNLAILSSTGNGAGCGCFVNPSISAPANSLGIAGAVSSAHKGANTWTFTSGFFGTAGTQLVLSGEFASTNGNYVFDMNFHPADINNYAEAAIVLYNSVPPTTTSGIVIGTTFVTVPPTPFQVQYWYFGVTVNLIILCVIVGFYMQNSNAEIGSDSFIFVTLLGAFLGSIVALLMNVYPWEVPAVIFGLLVVYLVRLRG